MSITQLAKARQGIVTDVMASVAADEHVDPELLRDEIARGRALIPANVHHTALVPVGIGRILRTKVNANIGNSSESSSLDEELHKLALCERFGADAVMDLSTGPDIDRIRQAMIDETRLPIGTVPVYQAAAEVDRFVDLTEDDFVEVIRKQAEQGVDFMTIHCGILRRHVPLVQERVAGIVSRGGSLMAGWMLHHRRENPIYSRFDDILDICAAHDVSLSLGDGLRPGCLADASDTAQFAELEVLGDLVRRCWAKDVQVMVEGPGHVPFDQIAMNMQKEEELCDGAPFYVLGPIVTDVSAGYDHIASAIGGTMAAVSGASMLCYVTPKEHLGLPGPEDVREGIMAHRIAAHAADIARGLPRARERDDAMSRARFRFDWEEQFSLALDPDRAREYRGHLGPDEDQQLYCSMCGPDFCAMKISKDLCTSLAEEAEREKGGQP